MVPGWGSLLWFIAVIAMIPVALWLLKRTPMGASGSGRAGAPRPVSVLALGAQHKLVTVEVGEHDERLWIVLGVSPQGIRTLHTMAAGTAVPDTVAAAPAAAFAQLLSRMRGPNADGKDGGDARP